MDHQISERSAEVQTVTQSCRQLDAGGSHGVIWVHLHCKVLHLLTTWKESRCVCVKTSFTELKELNSSLTTHAMTSEIQELQSECAAHRARLEKIKSATNHVTPAEKEKVGAGVPQGKESVWTPCGLADFWLSFFFFNWQVYKERELYVKEWRKRKRLVMLIFYSYLATFTSNFFLSFCAVWAAPQFLVAPKMYLCKLTNIRRVNFVQRGRFELNVSNVERNTTHGRDSSCFILLRLQTWSTPSWKATPRVKKTSWWV